MVESIQHSDKKLTGVVLDYQLMLVGEVCKRKVCNNTGIVSAAFFLA